MISVGADIIRIARLDKGERFLRRVFTALEIELCAGRPESLPGRWAAKEAVLKALGVGIGEVPLTDIEIAAEGTRPVVRLQAAAAELAGTAGLTDWQVTISHDGDYAVAFVVATGVSLET